MFYSLNALSLDYEFFFIIMQHNKVCLMFLICQMKYRLHPFSFCCLAFHGFSNEDKLHMEELTVANGMYVTLTSSRRLEE